MLTGGYSLSPAAAGLDGVTGNYVFKSDDGSTIQDSDQVMIKLFCQIMNQDVLRVSMK